MDRKERELFISMCENGDSKGLTGKLMDRDGQVKPPNTDYVPKVYIPVIKNGFEKVCKNGDKESIKILAKCIGRWWGCFKPEIHGCSYHDLSLLAFIHGLEEVYNIIPGHTVESRLTALKACWKNGHFSGIKFLVSAYPSVSVYETICTFFVGTCLGQFEMNYLCYGVCETELCTCPSRTIDTETRLTFLIDEYGDLFTEKHLKEIIEKCDDTKILTLITEKYPVTLTDPYYDLISSNILDGKGCFLFDKWVLTTYKKHELFDFLVLVEHAIMNDDPERLKLYLDQKDHDCTPENVWDYILLEHSDKEKVLTFIQETYGFEMEKFQFCVVL